MSKTWEAVDVSKEQVTYDVVEITDEDQNTTTNIRVTMGYDFLDQNGDKVEDVNGGQVVEQRPLSEVPSDMLDALEMVRDFMYNKALDEEGLS